MYDRNLGELRNLLPNVPIMALTATATPNVRKDICNSLNLMYDQHYIFKSMAICFRLLIHKCLLLEIQNMCVQDLIEKIYTLMCPKKPIVYFMT